MGTVIKTCLQALPTDQLEKVFVIYLRPPEKKERTKYSFWGQLRSLFKMFDIENWTDLIKGIQIKNLGNISAMNTC